MQTGLRVRSVIQIHREGLVVVVVVSVVAVLVVVVRLVFGRDKACGRKVDRGSVVIVVAGALG